MLVIFLALMTLRMCSFATYISLQPNKADQRCCELGSGNAVAFRVSDLFPCLGEAEAVGMSWG